MILLLNDAPEYCPDCGNRLDIEEDSFFNGNSISCICGAGMQFLATNLILEVCEEIGGDLQYQDIHAENKLLPEMQIGEE